MKPSDRIREMAANMAIEVGMPSFDDDHEHFKIGFYLEAILKYLDEQQAKKEKG